MRMRAIRDPTMVLSAAQLMVNILCVLLVLNLLSGHFGIASISLLHIIATFVLLGVIILNLPLKHTIKALGKTPTRSLELYCGLLFLIGGFLLLLFSETGLLWLTSVPVLLSGLSLCLRAMDQGRRELHWLSVTSFGYALVCLLLQTVPYLWNIYHQTSLLISQAVGLLTGTPLLLGPTMSGQGIVLVFLVFMIPLFLHIRQKNRQNLTWFLIGTGGVLLVWLAYLIALGALSYTSKADTVAYHPLFFLLCLIPVFIYLLKNRTSEAAIEDLLQKKPLKKLLRSGRVLAAVMIFLSGTILTIFVSAGTPAVDHRSVVFYGDHMLGSWDVPEYGKYGKDAVGMFGLWPVYLTTLGYEPEILVEDRTTFLDGLMGQDQNITRYLNLTDYMTIRQTETITGGLLDDAAVFVIANLNRSFSEEEHMAIWEYVHNGGSLLVIGDHTDVGGIQTPLNDLLSPVGIRYRFDATLPLDDRFKWLTCTHLLPHPITSPLPGLDTLQYGVGASLDVSVSSFPIIVGTYALSDLGNQTNEDIAYLGDYEYTNGEHLGDVILVAGAYYGDGRVLVFGDTSMFQNAALTFSYPFVQSIFTWLTTTQTGLMSVMQITVALFFLFAALVLIYLWRDTPITFAVFPVLLCASVLLTTAVNPLIIHPSEGVSTDNLVLIDASHNERFTLESFTDDSVNGLLVNLQRNDLLPVLLRDFSKEQISASRILVCIAPTLKFTPDEVSFLQRYMAHGGYIILGTGYEDKEASLPLLQACGVDVSNTPLGPVPYVESNTTLYQNEPRFVDSWPLSFPENQTTSYYNFSWEDHTFHLVIFVQQGNGGLLLIGDSQYLLDKNIESIYDYWPGNILFLKYLIDELHTKEDR